MITFKSVNMKFNDHHKPILNRVNFNINSGDFCILIGSNGSGKSTLLKLISGQVKADSGEIRVVGTVSQVMQDITQGTISGMTLLENIALSEMKKPKLHFYHRFRNKVSEKLEVLSMGLEKYLDHPMNMLSGGQKQMIATLMAINSGKDILLLDEHTSALDPFMQAKVLEYTSEQVTAKKITTVMITHRMEDAIKYGNRLMMLHKGRIILDLSGSAKQSIKSDELTELFHRHEGISQFAGAEYEY